MKHNIGIVGTGIYIPQQRMTAREISEATQGKWTEDAIISKLGIQEIVIPGPEDGTQEMGVKAAMDCLKNTGVDAKEIDLILCIGEEWKEYPLTTSGIYIQEQIGATNAWAIDIQQRCGTTVAGMKMAKDMMIADEDINTVMIVGGYRNGDFIDFTDPSVSFMYNLSAGAGALIMKTGMDRNLLLGTHIMTDGSLARDVAVEFGGTINPVTCENASQAYKSLRVFDEKHMKDRLNEVSMDNWMHCIDRAIEKSGLAKSNLSYLACLHFKRSMYEYMVNSLDLTMEQTVYLENYGHLGQIDQILSLHLGLKEGKIKDGTVISMIAAGIGYAWGANVIKWG
ncbi:MAG: 3-oxoacyl-ACP synthase [Salinivirgaceae bacterium]